LWIQAAGGWKLDNEDVKKLTEESSGSVGIFWIDCTTIFVDVNK
jgi:hypothetical protein